MEIAQQRKTERAIAASADAEAQEATKLTRAESPAAGDALDPNWAHRRVQDSTLHAHLAGTDEVSAYFGGHEGLASGLARRQNALHVAMEDDDDFVVSQDLRRRVKEAEEAMGRPRPGGHARSGLLARA